MAHTSCPNGHDMWNGDGKPVVWAFRVNFFVDFMRQHPGYVVGKEGYYWQIYDCFDGIPGEDLDCWYCEECKGLAVFVDNYRYDYVRMQSLPDVKSSDVDDWEEYIALRDVDFEDFQDFCDGKDPVEAINTYSFQYKYRLSPDKKTIYAFDEKGLVQFGYTQTRLYEFEKNEDPDPDRISRIEIKYHRCTKIKPGNIPLDATWEYVTWDYNEELVLDAATNVLTQVCQIGTGCKVTHTYEVEGGICSFLEDYSADLFSIIEGNPPDVIDNPMEQKDYEIRILSHQGSERIVTGTYDKNGLPVDWADFIDSVWNFMRFYGIGEIFDESNYNRPRRRESDLIFCKVTFDEWGQTYTYLADTDDYNAGDLVVVPVGRDNHESVARIDSIEYRQPEVAPFPLEKTKHIIRKYQKPQESPQNTDG